MIPLLILVIIIEFAIISKLTRDLEHYRETLESINTAWRAEKQGRIIK